MGPFREQGQVDYAHEVDSASGSYNSSGSLPLEPQSPGVNSQIRPPHLEVGREKGVGGSQGCIPLTASNSNTQTLSPPISSHPQTGSPAFLFVPWPDRQA